MKKILSLIFIFVSFLSAGCQKDTTVQPISSGDLTCAFNGVRPVSSYVYAGDVGKVGTSEYDNQLYIFQAESGLVVIKQYNFRINVNDGSRPIAMLRSTYYNDDLYDAFNMAPRKKQLQVLVDGFGSQDISFKEVSDTVRYIPNFGHNVAKYDFDIIYSDMITGNMTSGKTRVSLTLVSVEYEKDGIRKTLTLNLKNRDRMLVYSHLNSGGDFRLPGSLKLGMNKLCTMPFSSYGGDNLLEEFPLKIIPINCKIGSVPKISVAIYDSVISGTPSIIPAGVTVCENNIFKITLPTPYLVKDSHDVFVEFYVDVSEIGTPAQNTSLEVWHANLKYYTWKEMKTGTVFSVENEFFVWQNAIDMCMQVPAQGCDNFLIHILRP